MIRGAESGSRLQLQAASVSRFETRVVTWHLSKLQIQTVSVNETVSRTSGLIYIVVYGLHIGRWVGGGGGFGAVSVSVRDFFW